MPEPTIAVRFIGGPYDGQTDMVPADEDKDPLIGTVPAMRTIRRPQPPEFRLMIPPALLDDDAIRLLYYDCQHRGGEWVYVLHGTDPATLPEKTDPLLEVFIAHVRRVWPQRRHVGNSHTVPAEVHQGLGEDYETHIRKRLMAQLHAAANAEGLLLIRLAGPDWVTTDRGFTDLCRVEGLAIPGFGMREPEANE